MEKHDELRKNTVRFEDLLIRRCQILEKIISEIKKELEPLPQGKLHISSSRAYTTYYQRNNPKEKTGKYIRKEEGELVQNLATREYLEKILMDMEKELAALKRLRTGKAEEVFAAMNLKRQNIVNPLYLPDDKFANDWLSDVKPGLPFDSEDDTRYITETGIRVRSKSEVIIADKFTKFGVKYKYEQPIEVNGIVLHPDFICLNERERRLRIHEHFGLMGNPDYIKSVLKKLITFEEAGFKLGEDFIFTMESADFPLDINHLERMIKHYLL